MVTRRDTLDERSYNKAVRAFKLAAKKAVGRDPEKDGSDNADERTLAGSDHGDNNNAHKKSPPLGPDERTPFTGKVQGTAGPAGTEREDGKIEIGEDDCWELIGYSFPVWKKWAILSVIFAIQCSMNFNASVYANAVPGLQAEFGISAQAARVGQAVFLICYGFGCELWAPWSEDYGRRLVLQLSLFLVNIWQIPAALAPNFGTIVVARVLGGLSSAGGSVTLGMVADFYTAENHGYGLAFVVFSSVGGSVLGPIFGGFLQEYASWHWVFWTQLIFGGVVQAIHFFFVPETRSSVLITREARRRRKNGETNVYSSAELEPPLTFKRCVTIWKRPFVMFATEPIVLFLSLLSGFSDALIFTFLESFGPVFKQWNFSTVDVGLAFISIFLGYVLCYAYYIPFIYRDNRDRRRDPDAVTPERRLYPLLWTAPLEPIGLFLFAWAGSHFPSWVNSYPTIPWIVPMIWACFIGIANYSIYQATIDYMVAAYGPYAASATGGNGFARDVLAGIAAMYATPMYENINPPYYNLQWASTILGVVSVLVTIPVYIIYKKGPTIRARSKFACELENERNGVESRRTNAAKEKGSKGANTSGAEEEQVESVGNNEKSAQQPETSATQ